MSLSPWSEDESYETYTEIEVLSGQVILERQEYIRGLSGRRLKAALMFLGLWSVVATLHWVTWGSRFVYGVLALLSLQALRLVLAQPEPAPLPLPPLAEAAADTDTSAYPKLSLMVAAKDEAAVIGRLIEDLCTIDYPSDRYEVWVIDDASEDNTPQLLKTLQSRYAQLKVFRRPALAGGGKSGALNQVWPLTQGDFLAIFDADARVPRDLARSVLPYFDRSEVGAVQVRKIIANADHNFVTQGQSVEMMLDAYFQQQRTAIGGLGELRGNGQFLRRKALERCGGFNEATITDDLDLTLRLNLDQWEIAFCLHPGVEEEGVTTPIALWHQRNRWAEGGYQRYLDYWRLLLSNRLGTVKSLDTFGFLIIQYLLPIVMVPDLLLAGLLRRPPLLTPMTSLSLGLPLLGLFVGIRRVHRVLHPGQTLPLLPTLVQTLQGLVYMLHWVVIMASVTTRMTVREKRLKWVKTVHYGE